MKQAKFLFILLAITTKSFAQTNFYRLSVGGGVGGTVAFADLEDQKITFAGYGEFSYYFTPFVSLGLEVQKGQVAGGNVYTDRYHREFVNSYLSGSANLKVHLGEFLGRQDLNNIFLNTVRGAYLGAGFGYIKNDVSNIRSWNGVIYPGVDKSTEAIVPLNAGINFYIPNQWGYNRFVINLNLQHTIVFGEGLDGYGVSGAPKQHNDLIWSGTAGIKYLFGPMGLDRRR